MQFEEKKKNRVPVTKGSDNLYTAYISGYLEWIVEHVASKQAGDNRNIAIYWAGRSIAGIQNTEWCQPYLHLLDGIDKRIICSSIENGYYAQYAGNDSEIERIFNRGILAGGEELEAPNKIADERIVKALNKVKPELTQEQKLQAVIHTQDIIEQLAEEKSWIRFNRLIKEYNVEIGFPQAIIDYYSIGYRPKGVNQFTGEIYNNAITIPFYNEKGEVVSVEYREDDTHYTYDGLPSLYKVKPMIEEQTSGILILPDSIQAINFYLNGANSFELYALPHENEFAVNLPDQERYCIFDRTMDINYLEELDSHNVRFVQVGSVDKLLNLLPKKDVERLATKGKRLKEVI